LLVDLAKGAENAGCFNSLWVLERFDPLTHRLLILELKTANHQLIGYIFDPLETFTFVAANTNKVALETSVIDMLFHNPVRLARRFATLDVMSEGRAIAGCGIGWSKEEYEISGIPFKKRQNGLMDRRCCKI